MTQPFSPESQPFHPETPARGAADAAAAFAHVRFVMVHPSHPGNVGAAARAIKTMGFHDLCLVAPRFPDVLDLPEAQSLASGATDVLAAVTIVPTLEQALALTTLAFALTARARVLGPPPCDIREAAQLSCAHLQRPAQGRVAIVLGTERSGLTNEDIALCQRVCHIPANPEYSSLNVAQALQLAAWELRYALASAASLPLLPSTEGQAEAGDEPAPNEKLQALMVHWEQAITEVGFLDPQHPKKLMPRMRHMFGRNGLSHDEVDMLRGLCTAMIKAARRG
ncbi:RNA methyltransferase [Pusillimonas sp. SM2304]|uniref:RNA methyltransferase n=1 Tax=Pusillimonas sp. SM2304 TaxID=3073241 RepID=UPI002875BD1E|nr:RNA methyltransferase [Pusillimonas sp. SM2304]MDS1142295.1 RNA methyltransferase [Pusillimonas sp. SM2304]